VARWTCPRCDREFGKTRQSHTCIPGGSVDDTFRGKPPEQRVIYDAIATHLKTLGRVHADAVTVGVFLKTDRKLAELRPKSKWLSCNLYLPYAIEDARIARTIQIAHDRYVNEVKLRTVDDVDEQLRDWLTAAFDENTD
jgi:hypothetical protein